MDANADFINAVAAGQNLICPQCGTLNESDSKFCYACGTRLSPAPAPAAFAPATPAFEAPVSEPAPVAFAPATPAFEAPASEPAPAAFAPATPAFEAPVSEPAPVAFAPASPEPAAPVSEPAPVVFAAEAEDSYDERELAFARGLPEWTIEPPQVMVRRRTSK